MANWPYNTKQWRQLRKAMFTENPMCVMCAEMGKDTIWTHLDHIKPVKSHPELAFDPANLQGLCNTCHNSIKQREERSGRVVGSKLDGSPVDPGHHWNK
jgi:5-methylcytosine-specific restriction endonuclease McrA